MAASRGGVASWMGRVLSHGGQTPVQRTSWTLSQVLDGQRRGRTRPLSSAAWALSPPNGLRYQTVRQPVLSHPLHQAGVPEDDNWSRAAGVPEDDWSQAAGVPEDDWSQAAGVPEDDWSRAVCVPVRLGECDGLRTLLDVPLFAEGRAGAPLRPAAAPSSQFSFPLTTVDGCRPDDIMVDNLKTARSRGSFRSLFEAEGCPAPYVLGSTFYCFHCPATRLALDGALTSARLRLNPEGPGALTGGGPWPDITGGGPRPDGDRKGDQDLDLMFDRLRLELPGFFMSNHDYSMYSTEVEFINGLLHLHTRGRLLYRLTLSLWRLLCLCYYAEARLDVLKLTKHPEDGSVRARWRIKGLPYHSLLLRFYRRDKSLLYRSYDAFSTFYVGQDGLIHCHRVDKVMPAPPPVLPQVTSLLAGALVALGLQEHRPALNLLPPLLSSLRQDRT